MSSPPSPRRTGLDWSQWLYPGPKRQFTPEELARAGNQPWPKGIDHYVIVNLVLLLAVFSRQHSPWAWPVALGLGGGALAIARWLWQLPSRRRLNLASYGVAIALAGGSMVVTARGGRAAVEASLLFVLAVLTAVLSGWWVLTLYRAEQIEGRLRELAEQDAALRLSTRLAAAQIQPHFLFNTLASLQHWVDTGDARAAPLLRDFTAYLRATLPMFERELQPLGDEIEMVRRYLAIMQARLGPRLTFAIDVSAELPTPVPPGIVLTLVENAIAHGIEPQLQGGRVTVAAHRAGDRLVLTVRDDGAGLAPGCADGVGLANSRRRLVNACPGATLALTDAAPGCLATLTLPIA